MTTDWTVEVKVLVIVDWLGTVKAREGDFVRLGGGDYVGAWNACRMFEVSRAPGC